MVTIYRFAEKCVLDSKGRYVYNATGGLHHDGTAWRKRNSDSTFDVTMGSYENAEVCELIGLFILDKLKDRFGYDIGLYRDDGLATLNTRSGRLT